MSLGHRWRRYWFPEGGRASAAAVRIAVSITVLWSLVRFGRQAYIVDPASAPADIYHPVGLLLPFLRVPPPAVIHLAEIVAWGATIFLLVGLFTRAAAALSLVASLLVASYAVSFTPDWPHDHNLPLLALIAMQGTQAGDVLGVDGWWRRRRGRPAPPSDGFAWTPRLVQLIAALMFLAAAAFKLGAAHFTLRWALSDNLRHQILVQFDINHLPRSWAADWLLVSPWRYQTIALLNLANQLAPMLACVFVERPRLRFVFGCCFLAEVLGIGLVMNLWDLHWLPLFAAFVDWDRLLAWWSRRRRALAPPPSEPAAGAGRPHRAASIFIALFVAYDVAVSFAYPRIDHALRTYPFSAYPMFSIVRAKEPYDEHQSYELVAGRFELITDAAPGARDAAIDPRAIDHAHRGFVYRKLHRIGDPARLRDNLEALLRDVQTRFPAQRVRGVRLWATSYQIPAHPAPARLVPLDLGLMGELAPDGTWTSALTRVVRAGDRWTIAPPPGVDLATARVLAFVDGWPEPRPITVERAGDAWTAALPDAKLVHVVAELDGAGSARRMLLARLSKGW